MNKQGFRLLLLFLCLMAGRSQASIVTFYFEGTVDMVISVESKFQVGMPMTGSASYDTTTPDSAPSEPNVGRYYSALSVFSMTVGGHEYTLNSNGDIHVRDGSSNSSLDYVGRDVAGEAVNGMLPISMYFFIRSTSRIFTSDALPTEAPVLSDFDWDRVWEIDFDGGQGRLGRGAILGTLTWMGTAPRQQGQVPEPGPVLLVVLGIFLTAVCACARRELF